MPGERKWYVVQTYASYEKRVKDDLTQRIKAMKMQDKIFSVLIPTETNIVVKDGKSREVTRKLYPGYVMIEMVLDEQSWYTVRHTPGSSAQELTQCRSRRKKSTGLCQA